MLLPVSIGPASAAALGSSRPESTAEFPVTSVINSSQHPTSFGRSPTVPPNAPPRMPGETRFAWARRLREVYPTFSVPHISAIAGLNASSLRKLPEFKKPSDDALAARDNTPRREGETSSGWARRLRVAHPELSVQDISAISGVDDRSLRKMAPFKRPTAVAQAARDYTPRKEGETSSAWARRLRVAHPALTVGDISAISGLNDPSLRQIPEFKTPSSDALAARNITPRKELEKSSAWARRLRVAHPALSVRDISAISGLNESTLRQMSEFKVPSDYARTVRDNTPRREEETELDWARRLRVTHPELTVRDISAISGAHEATLRNMALFKHSQRGVGHKLAPDEPALTFDEQINSAILKEMYSERATPMSIFAPSPAPPSPVTKAVFSQQDILDTANLLLRNPMRFSNSLSDHAPAMLLASGALPENTVLTIGESAGMGGVRILRRNQDSVTEPHASELHLDLILVQNEGLPSVQYFYRDRKGNMIEPRGNPEECFYRAVSGALRLRGHTGPASVLRNAVADEFLAHPHVWLNYVDLDSLFDELQQVRERLAHHPLGT